MIGAVFGVVVFVAGLGLMWLQWHVWQSESVNSKSNESRNYAYRKFRRRTLIGSMIAIIGAMFSAVFYAEDPRVKMTMVIGMLLLLVLLLFFALVDALSVYVHFNHGERAALAQKKMAAEYKRMREQALQQAADNANTGDEQPD